MEFELGSSLIDVGETRPKSNAVSLQNDETGAVSRTHLSLMDGEIRKKDDDRMT